MSVYKNDKPEWVEQAMESILSQTLKNDDVVIIRDGKVSDDIEKLLKKYEKRKDVRVVRLAQNRGLAHALNVGLKKCKNELVARMDADDVMAKNRLKVQLAAFNKNQDLDIFGGQVAEFEESLKNITGHRKVPTTADEIRKFAKLRNPCNHPSVMFKKSTISRLGGYDDSIGRVEDYELWMRALNSGARVENSPEILCYLRAGDYMVGRRKDWRTCSAQLQLRKKFLLNGWINIIDFTKASSAFIVIAVLPTPIVGLIYKKGLRSAAVR